MQIYVETITAYAIQHPEFKEIVAQETQWIPWAKEKVIQWCGKLNHILCEAPPDKYRCAQKEYLSTWV